MAASENELHAALEQRLKGDRSGACIAAAVIENGTEARAYFCAGAKSERSIDGRTAFEIGSITKTMTAALLAEIIGRGTPITVGNIVTHTSGLPSLPWRATDWSNPYARLTEVDLLDTPAKMQLKHAPGSRREYSNFALMVLSYALAKHSGSDFETLLRERLLSPLGMDGAYIVRRPPNVRLARLQFSVTDTGPGIPADHQARIFEQFRQVDNSNTKAKGGTGLELAIAKLIIEMHGGRIWVESFLGKSSTLQMELPTRAPICKPAS